MPDFVTMALAPANWPTFAFLLARLGGFMMAAPVWSMTAIPGIGRAAITVLLAVCLLPLAPRGALPEPLMVLPMPLAMEFLVGTVIGLCAAVLVQGVALAGEILSIQMGISLGPVLSPMPDAPVSGIGQIKSFLALVIYLSVEGHTMLIQALAGSLTAIPPGAMIRFDHGDLLASSLLATFYTTAIRAAAPVMVALLLTNIAVAILGRAVPQLNVILVALPITIGVGLVMIGSCLSFLAPAIAGWMASLPETIGAALQGFRSSPWAPGAGM
jgi:flagellar biosynthetic protein FliR